MDCSPICYTFVNKYETALGQTVLVIRHSRSFCVLVGSCMRIPSYENPITCLADLSPFFIWNGFEGFSRIHYMDDSIAPEPHRLYPQILDTTPQKRMLVCWEQSASASPFKQAFESSILAHSRRLTDFEPALMPQAKARTLACSESRSSLWFEESCEMRNYLPACAHSSTSVVSGQTMGEGMATWTIVPGFAFETWSSPPNSLARCLIPRIPTPRLSG